MGSPRREGRSSRRPTAKRRLSRRILIVCGGRVTEKQYFQGLRAAERNPAVRVVIKTNPRSPIEVVRYAYKLKRQAPDEFDDVWCVFDVDEFTGIDDAVRLAGRQGIGVAVSNPCFELWLLLHFDRHTAHCPSFDALLPLLRRYVPAYDKAALDFGDYAALVTDGLRTGAGARPDRPAASPQPVDRRVAGRRTDQETLRHRAVSAASRYADQRWTDAVCSR